MSQNSTNSCCTNLSRTCTAGSKRYSSPYCVDDGTCQTVKIVKVETLDATCAATAVEYFVVDGAGNVTTTAYTGALTVVPCEVMRVKVVDACPDGGTAAPLDVNVLSLPPPAPITLTGHDAAGAPLPANGLQGQLVNIVQELGQVLDVRLVDPQKDYEKVVLCDKVTGNKIAVISDLTVPTAPVVSLWDLTAASAYAGTVADLEVCASAAGTENVGIVACLAGAEIPGIAWFTDDAARTPLGETWRDPVTGAWGALPAGAIVGKCAQCEVTPLLEFGFYNSLAVSGGPVSRVGFLDGVNANFSDPVTGQYEVVFTIDGVAQVGNGAGLYSGGDFPVPFTSIQSIADYFNSHPANTAPKDNWVAGPNFLVISNDPPNHAWTGMVSYHDNAGINDYNHFKGDPEPVTVELVTAASCRKIEVIKFIDCNRNIVDIKGFEVNGTAIDNFDRSLLVAECPAAQKLVLNPVHWDDNGVCTEGKAWYAEDTGGLVNVTTLDGVVVTVDPTTLKEGACPAVIPERKVLIYLERNGGVVTMADIESAVGTNKIQSVTVKQISGTGSVSGDAGSGVPLSTGEVWSWSAITGQDAWDFLGASALSIDAGGGEQRITALYIP